MIYPLTYLDLKKSYFAKIVLFSLIRVQGNIVCLMKTNIDFTSAGVIYLRFQYATIFKLWYWSTPGVLNLFQTPYPL